MFKPQFAPLVEQGTKLQTMRPTPKRMPQPGDQISLRAWTGKPYRSKQRELRSATITRVSTVRIEHDRIAINDVPFGNWNLGAEWMRDFARADGFDSWESLAAWFDHEHGLPFDGVLIQWGGGGGFSVEPSAAEKEPNVRISEEAGGKDAR
jgi:hypothetical protein